MLRTVFSRARSGIRSIGYLDIYNKLNRDDVME